MKTEPKRARTPKRARADEKQAKQGETKRAAKQSSVRRKAAVGDGIGPSTY